MGVPADDVREEDASKPQHPVRISRRAVLGCVPVTQGLYSAVMGTNPARNLSSLEHPVERVSWFDAVRFCNALSGVCGLRPAYTIGEGRTPAVSCDFAAPGFRLPTEAEWEYAARAGQGFAYSGADDVHAVAWHANNSARHTHPVGTLQPNAWGLYDMSGNVGEWCWDPYSAYPSHAVVDPVGPPKSDGRVVRGGSWTMYPPGVRVQARLNYSPESPWAHIGLRLAMTVSS